MPLARCGHNDESVNMNISFKYELILIPDFMCDKRVSLSSQHIDRFDLLRIHFISTSIVNNNN